MRSRQNGWRTIFPKVRGENSIQKIFELPPSIFDLSETSSRSLKVFKFPKKSLVFQIPFEKICFISQAPPKKAFRGSKHLQTEGIWRILEDYLAVQDT